MKPAAMAVAMLMTATILAAAQPTSMANDDTCEIRPAPAATLLLPYFEVDFSAPRSTARTTLFTVTNVSRLPQIAHVILWTDWGYPVVDFPLFLTGYDVQGIDLWDVLNKGVIAPTGPTSAGTSAALPIPNNTISPVNAPGAQPASNTGNPNLTVDVRTVCANLPGFIPDVLLAEMQRVLTTGAAGGTVVAPSCTARLGGLHQHAIGYLTVDVVSTCTPRFPGPEYFLNDLLYDNVLIGDYENINPDAASGNYAGGNPMVHIRAVPEGGPAGSIPGTALPYTFYDRFTPQPFVPRTVDRRQPLPSTFAARYIQGGNGQFNTRYAIWREGVSGPIATSCAASANSAMAIAEVVRFDEHENATTILINGPQIPTHIALRIALPAASSAATSDSSVFPQLSTSGDVGGWMYLNLNNGGSTNYSSTRAGYAGPGTSTTAVRQSQNWVIVSMYAEGRYGVEFDAPALGNGCSVAPPAGATIGPTGNNVNGTYIGSVPICPTFDTGATMPCANNPAYRGTNGTPP